MPGFFFILRLFERSAVADFRILFDPIRMPFMIIIIIIFIIKEFRVRSFLFPSFWAKKYMIEDESVCGARASNGVLLYIFYHFTIYINFSGNEKKEFVPHCRAH